MSHFHEQREHDTDDDGPPSYVTLPSPKVTPREDPNLRRKESSSSKGKRSSTETSSARNSRMKTNPPMIATKAMPGKPPSKPATYKQAAEECRDSGADMRPPPKVPPVDLSKVKPKAMPDYRPEHLKMLLTPRTGQPPNSLPPGTTLNFNDVPSDDQPGRDFDQPFGIKDFDRMNGPDRRWFDRFANFFDRIADNIDTQLSGRTCS